MSNAFTADAGLYQGRCIPVGGAIEGTYVYELGHQLPGVVRSIAVDGAHSVDQAWDLTGVHLVRARARIRAAHMPPDLSWVFSVDIDGHQYIARTITRDAEVFDLAHPATMFPGVRDVRFVLTLAGPPGLYDVELPSVAIDGVVADATVVTPILINRDPEPGETGIPLDAAIALSVFDTLGTGLAATSLLISVNGVLVYDGATGTVAPGWAGFVSPDAGTKTLSALFLPTAPLAPLTVYTVAVHATGDGGKPVLDESYSFTTADTIQPQVDHAVATGRQSVKVDFDEPINQGPATSAASALNPSNYALSLVSGAPAVTPGVVGAVSDGTTKVILALDIFQTPGAIYRVTVVDVEDLFGNIIDPAGNSQLFTGWQPALPAGRDVSLFRALPELNQAEDVSGEHERFLGCMQEVIDLYFALLDEWTVILDFLVAPEPWVDLLLADLGNPFSFLPFTLLEKRKLCGLLLRIYRTKGTGPGIVEAANVLLGLTVTIQVYAWAPYGLGFVNLSQTFVLGTSTQADLYTFLVVSPIVLTADQRVKLRAIADYMKAAHEHFRIVEPAPVVVVDHWQLGFDGLGQETVLH